MVVLDLHPLEVLHQPRLNKITEQLHSIARELALLGAIRWSHQLFSLLCRSGVLGVTVKRWRGDLFFAWKLTGSFPDGLPDEYKSDEVSERLKETYASQWGDIRTDARLYDENGLKACLEPPSEGQKRYMDSEHQILVKAFDISISLYRPQLLERKQETSIERDEDQRLEISALDSNSAEIVRRIAARWNEENFHDYLVHAEKLWPLYGQGLLANALGVDHETIEAKAGSLCAAFTERLKSGYADTSLALKTTKRILEIGNENTINPLGPSKGFWMEWGEHDRSETLFHPPAAETAIAELEKRLGVVLPEDYKQFLRITNGFGDGIKGMFNGMYLDEPIHGTENVKWLGEQWIKKLPIELLDIGDGLGILGTRQFDDFKSLCFDRVIEIGHFDEQNLWLVPPEEVCRAKKAYLDIYESSNDAEKLVMDRIIEEFAGTREAFEDLEWCCVEWGIADLVAYPSLRRYLEERVSRSFLPYSRRF